MRLLQSVISYDQIYGEEPLELFRKEDGKIEITAYKSPFNNKPIDRFSEELVI